MKQAILAPSDFLAPEAEAWAKEQGYVFIENLDQAKEQNIERCFLGINKSSELPKSVELTSEVQGVGVYDCIHWKNGVPWPELLLKKEIQSMIAHRNWSLPRHQPCFLWGDSCTLRWMASFVLQAGFRQIIIFHPRPEWGDYFSHPGVNIQWIDEKTISGMNTIGGLFFVHFEEKNPPGQEFYELIKYMHFLEDSAYLIDLSKNSFLTADFLQAEHRIAGALAWQEILKNRLSAQK